MVALIGELILPSVNSITKLSLISDSVSAVNVNAPVCSSRVRVPLPGGVTKETVTVSPSTSLNNNDPSVVVEVVTVIDWLVSVGASLTLFTVKVSTASVLKLPSVAVTVTVSWPAKFSFGV